ncbi:hypothetical protein AUJ84_04415 [Candidatus Pacearchaeota archaeon CG1_02_32_132]|nr:MAG: hypothetical protein AUJ84_04415 [Candidatus Pacearchaeota archaeon CG1_02_32_132]
MKMLEKLFTSKSKVKIKNAIKKPIFKRFFFLVDKKRLFIKYVALIAPSPIGRIKVGLAS